jgi:Immunity protein 53
MNANDSIDAASLLQTWFHSRCDGAWEHSWRVTIETLDNPGWIIKIDLQDTHKAYEHLDQIKIRRNENDWVMCRIEKAQFIGSCGPLNLGETIKIFIDWFG